MKEESINKVKAKIGVLKLLKEKLTINDIEGERLSGDYWFDIKLEVSKRCKGDFFRTIELNGVIRQEGGIKVLSKEQVCSYLAECEDELERLEDEEYDRGLTRKVKEINMHYTKRAYTISLISLLISVLTATGVIKSIIEWLRSEYILIL